MLLPPASSTESVPVSDYFRTAPAPQRPLGGKSDNLDKLIWEQWTVPRLARRRYAQLLHVPYLSAPMRKTGPTVVTAHDMIPWVLPGYSGSLTVRLYLLLAAIAAKRADAIIADSDASRHDVIRVLKVPPDRVQTVYLGIEAHLEPAQQELDEVRARFGLPADFAFYIGGFDRRKSVPLLLSAWRAALDNLCPHEHGQPVLVMGGAVPEPGGVFPDVRAAAASLGPRDGGRVRFLGALSEADKRLLMSAARMFVYPSIYEGFGLDPLEAMSLGCPVVCSSGGSLMEVVGDAGLLVPPGDEQALSQAIARLWTDYALRSELGQRGKERARLFTWERTARQTYSIYEATLRPSKGESR